MAASRHAAQGRGFDRTLFEVARRRHQLFRILDLAGDGLIVTAANWKILGCTPVVETILNCTAAELIGLSVTRFFRADFSDCVRSDDLGRLPAAFRRVDAIRANGERFAAEFRVAAVPSHAQSVQVVFFRDVELQRAVRAAISSIVDTLSGNECGLFGSRGRDVVDDILPSAATASPPDETIRRLNMSLDRQAKRIAQALHDEAGQLLTAAYNSLSEIGQDLPPAAVARLGEVRRHLDRVETQLRGLAHELRPRILDDLGIVAAIRFLGDSVARRHNIVVTMHASVHGRLPALVETTVYRVVHEALNNASRHARPRRIGVVLRHSANALHCGIEDDGVGFEVTALEEQHGEPGFGLLGMRDQVELLGGAFLIESVPGRGTRLTITIPLSD